MSVYDDILAELRALRRLLEERLPERSRASVKAELPFERDQDYFEYRTLSERGHSP